MFRIQKTRPSSLSDHRHQNLMTDSPCFKTPKKNLFSSLHESSPLNGRLEASLEESNENFSPMDVENMSFIERKRSSIHMDLSDALTMDVSPSSSAPSSPFRKPALIAPLPTLLSHWGQRKPLHAISNTKSGTKSPTMASLLEQMSPPSSPSMKAPRTLLNYFSPKAESRSAAIGACPSMLTLVTTCATATAAMDMTVDSTDTIITSQETTGASSMEEDSDSLCLTPSSSPFSVVGETGERCQLPCVETGKDALKRISPETLVHLMQGDYDHLHDEKYIIDCRFPYEYEGGHIKSAINFNSMTDLEDFFLSTPMFDRRVVIVFHCEFSSHRAPRMALHLRKRDRMLNMVQYPQLYYPEIYILKGGYRDFFEFDRTCCDPPNYVPMNDASFKDDLRREMTFFKKSWKRCKSFFEVPHSDCFKEDSV